MEKVKYKILATGEQKKTDYAHLQAMIDIDCRCANRSFIVDDNKFQEKEGKLVKLETDTRRHTKAVKEAKESGTD